jgi:hypothetical protein
MTRIEVDDVLSAAKKWLAQPNLASIAARDAGSVSGA